ncbi:MAG: 3-deoxy-manno-octulosonate cytidylyltransferase [Rhizobiaceae bacterium]|jgi:3-deoxy-manno-octulosonate cytidylyltransferase (CMP-KDO synthetase)|nr:3-deoxy-manno-octulosonate cytidylyltransferase [Rhizobiaceae bacterium]
MSAFSAGPLILIPARMESTRLPGKPLADIAGRPMIVRVWERAVASGVGRVAVATDSAAVRDAVEAAGGHVVMTRADHPSGSDRIAEAALALDPERRHEIIINVQGDLPTLDPALIRSAADALAHGDADIATLACVIADDAEKSDPNVVKAIGTPLVGGRFRALYFTRATAPSGEGPLFHHIGLYSYRRAALERFVALPPATLETRERLEQLRALENGMRIDFALVDTVPLGVDTAVQLERARAAFVAGEV